MTVLTSCQNQLASFSFHAVTVLQAGRWLIRFPMSSLEFFFSIELILPSHYGPGVDSAPN
jgi:hypothetical protein